MDTVTHCKRIVVKIGTSTLTHATGRLNIRRIETLARVLSDIKNSGREVVLVSSGAVGAGVARMGATEYPRTAEEKQAYAAVGQAELMRLYERLFAGYGHTVGQILMTKDVVEDAHRAAQAKNTFERLLGMGCIPVVNENDCISVEELRFGGNDTLSAYVSVLCEADLLVNLTDIDGLFDSDPRKNPDAKLVSRVEAVDDSVMAMAGGAGSDRGTGGMVMKLTAAKICTAAGVPMLILNGRDPAVLYSIIDGEKIGTYFKADARR